VNGSEGLSIDIPPPAGSPRGSYGRGVARGTPLFFALMRDKLLHREHVVLVDEAHPRPADIHRVELTGGGLAGIAWLEVDIDKALSAGKPGTGEYVRYEDGGRKLAFVVGGYKGVKYEAAALEKLAAERFGKQPGFKAGAPAAVEVAGRELLTVAFRTGNGAEATDHALVLWPRSYFTDKTETMAVQRARTGQRAGRGDGARTRADRPVDRLALHRSRVGAGLSVRVVGRA
jgi:hypothetical protein